MTEPPTQPDSNLAPATAVSNHLRDYPDLALIERAKQGEALAFEALMRRYNRRLFRIARSILQDADAAEDAVQETYIQAFSNLHRYQPIGKFGAWLGRIAVNQALMLHRGAVKGNVSFDDLDDAALFNSEVSYSNEQPVSSRYVEGIQARQLLESAIDSLSEGFRVVFLLRRVEQLSVSETAAVLGLNESTVRTRLHRAERLLRNHLSRRLSREKISVFDFAGERCDRVVARVFDRLNLSLH